VRTAYACPLWLTFKQAIELGGHVRKGETGELVVYADRITRTETDAKGAEVEKAIPFLKCCRAPGERSAAERYREPSLFTRLERPD
jgi:antirestriction protein ArdC